MALLTREEILAVDDLKEDTVDVPEWGGSVKIRTISACERDKFEIASIGDADVKNRFKNLRARLVAMVCIDDEGNRIFTHDDVEALGKKSSLAMDRVFAAAQKLNRIGDAELQELAGN